VFTVAERDAARSRLLELAAGDARVVAGAVVGSLAVPDGDRAAIELLLAEAGGARELADAVEPRLRELVS